MLFMNQYEVEDALVRYAGHPILGPATRTLANLVTWTNENSDGWCYWPKPVRAAERLQSLIQASERMDYGQTDGEMWELGEAYKQAVRPIKAFRTRQMNQGLPSFEIVEV